MNKNSKKKDAPEILKMAVDILEEEIAAGILAAKKMEKKVFNLGENRNERPSDLMSRIRRDVHEAVDLFMDSVTVLTDYVGVLNDQVSRADQNGQNNNGSATRQTSAPIIKNDQPAHGGDQIELKIMLTNDSSKNEKQIDLKKPELVNIVGQKINPRNIRFIKSKFVLKPQGQQEVAITLNLPKATQSGTYTGLIQDVNNPEIHVLMIVEID